MFLTTQTTLITACKNSFIKCCTVYFMAWLMQVQQADESHNGV